MEETVYVQSEVAKVPDNVFGTAQRTQKDAYADPSLTFWKLDGD